MKPNDILQAVAETFDLTVEDLRSTSRTKRLVTARGAAVLLLHDHLPWLSLAEIGKLLGGRDHSTIIYALQSARARGRAEPPFQQNVMQALNAARAAACQA